MKKNIASNEEISSLCYGLSLLLKAGMVTGEDLLLLAEESDPAYQDMFKDMANKIDDGLPLSTVLEQTGRFPAYVCRLIKAGEKSGKLEHALLTLSNYYEGRARLDRRIRSALLYPAVMLVLMLVVIAVLLVRVLPIFDDVYASLGGQLTGVAGGLLTLGRWLDGAMPVLLAVLAVVVVFLALFAAVEPFRAKITAMWRGSHGDKGLSRKMNTARLAQAMAMCMASGMPLEETVDLAAGLMADIPPAKARCEDCRARMDGGASLINAMQESEMLPAAQCRLLKLGQDKGKGDSTMEKIAQNLLEESEAALEDKVSRVEPALVMVCSILVGLILLSVMLPLMHIMAAIG